MQTFDPDMCGGGGSFRCLESILCAVAVPRVSVLMYASNPGGIKTKPLCHNDQKAMSCRFRLIFMGSRSGLVASPVDQGGILAVALSALMLNVNVLANQCYLPARKVRFEYELRWAD